MTEDRFINIVHISIFIAVVITLVSLMLFG